MITKKSDVEEAVSCLLKAIDIYTDMGRFTMAAKHHQSIAEMYESDPNTLVKWKKNLENLNPLLTIGTFFVMK